MATGTDTAIATRRKPEDAGLFMRFDGRRVGVLRRMNVTRQVGFRTACTWCGAYAGLVNGPAASVRRVLSCWDRSS
ncbi:protein of unknown function [Paraburkholderia kururiensis]